MTKVITKHFEFLNHAFELAENARGRTSPNPFVGALIIKNGKIVGKGFTKPAGGNHAEIQALKESGKNSENATMYVTLEPCAHYGKTPPCTEAIIKSKIDKVVIGAKDPNSLVNGKGISKLKSAGIEVICDVMPEKFRKQNEAYITYITKKRPFIILKSAISLDGKMAKKNGNSKWISCEKSRKIVHKIRNEIDAILSTVNTVNSDNPQFTVRYNLKNPKHPIRIILDANLNINPDSHIVHSAKNIRTIIATNKNPDSKKLEFLESKKVEIWKIRQADNYLNLTEILEKCYQNEIAQIMIEAGPTLIFQFLKKKLVDKILLFMAPKIFGGSDKFLWIKSSESENDFSKIRLKDVSYKKSGDDIMIEGYPIYGDKR